MPTIILPCTCIDSTGFQDEEYGQGRRVHNISGRDPSIAYCTNCSLSWSRQLRTIPNKDTIPGLQKAFGFIPDALVMRGNPGRGGKKYK